jgi:hypothetical protein
MDPYLEANPIFQELHTQMLALAQVQLQPRLRPKYLARLERALSEGSVWDQGLDLVSLEGKEPDLPLLSTASPLPDESSIAVLATPSASLTEELQPEERELRKQRRIVIYLQTRPRRAVAAIELLSPSNKEAGSLARERYLEKRSSALHGGLHWVEIDLVRGGQRPPLRVAPPPGTDYLAYVAQATPTGWKHLLYSWGLREPIRQLPIPLLGTDRVVLDLAACFTEAYDGIAAEEEVDYTADPPPPRLRDEDRAWVDALLRQHHLRP